MMEVMPTGNSYRVRTEPSAVPDCVYGYARGCMLGIYDVCGLVRAWHSSCSD
jgi:hypothetical protein